MKKNRQNPLRKRYLRELRGDFGKYLVIFILLVFTIGLISGFLVADGSMIIAYNESFEKYRIEDGNFQTDDEISRANRRKIEKSGVILYDNFYIEKKLKDGNTLRIFKNREEINLLCLMEGRFPEKRGDLVIDRMYADNNGIHVGDELQFGKSIFVVTGLVAFPDYSALFQNNSDAMFDAVKFGIGAVGREDFDSFASDELTWCYSWKYTVPPGSKEEEKKV